MNRGIKIFVAAMVFLGLLSLIFLLVAKKKPQIDSRLLSPQLIAELNKKKNPAANTKKVAVQQTTTNTNQSDPQKTKDQWQQCKARTIEANTNLFWNVQISEAIPDGGTYAKGTLAGDIAYPVRVIIKSDSPNAQKIKELLVIGKMTNLRGTCIDVTSDGIVIFQAF